MNEFDLNNLINDFTQFFPEILLPSTEDVMCLSKKIDQLTIDVNTQNLKIELETLKRRKLRSSIKQVKSEVLSLKTFCITLKYMYIYLLHLIYYLIIFMVLYRPCSVVTL